MNTLSIVMSLLGVMLNADASRLLLQIPCENVQCPEGTQCQSKSGGVVGQIECSVIPNYCTIDSECAVKNVGNCCGYYPGCVNINYTPDLGAVRRQCEESGMASVCGWSQPSGCACQNNQCQAHYGTSSVSRLHVPAVSAVSVAAATNNCDILPDGYKLVGTPDQCMVIRYFCEEGYTHWSDECGCGCKLDCASLSKEYRIIGTPEECPRIRFGCNIGEGYFVNDCGCGCKQIENPCASMICLRGTECVDNGDGTGSCVAY